jgi:glycyl-tRNA synthetase
MKTFVGPLENDSSVTYLRGETCQGIFMDYPWVLNSSRMKLPFGIAQIGKAFRNEINPNNFTYRTREFEQMEMEFFVDPKEADKYFDMFMEERMQ